MVWASRYYIESYPCHTSKKSLKDLSDLIICWNLKGILIQKTRPFEQKNAKVIHTVLLGKARMTHAI